eukprot:gene1475-2796_t
MLAATGGSFVAIRTFGKNMTSAKVYTEQRHRHTYWNNAGTSWPKPQPVLDAVEETMKASPGDWPKLFAQHTNTIRRLLALSSEHRLLFTPGATSALNIAIMDHGWNPGKDAVIVHGLAHH